VRSRSPCDALLGLPRGLLSISTAWRARGPAGYQPRFRNPKGLISVHVTCRRGPRLQGWRGTCERLVTSPGQHAAGGEPPTACCRSQRKGPPVRWEAGKARIFHYLRIRVECVWHLGCPALRGVSYFFATLKNLEGNLNGERVIHSVGLFQSSRPGSKRSWTLDPPSSRGRGGACDPEGGERGTYLERRLQRSKGETAYQGDLLQVLQFCSPETPGPLEAQSRTGLGELC